MQIMWLVEKHETLRVHFTLDLKGTRDRRNSNDWKLGMAVSGYCLMVYWILHLDPSRRGSRAIYTLEAWGPATTLHDVGGVSGRPLDTFSSFGPSQSHGHGSWARVWSGPKVVLLPPRSFMFPWLRILGSKFVCHTRAVEEEGGS